MALNHHADWSRCRRVGLRHDQRSRPARAEPIRGDGTGGYEYQAQALELDTAVYESVTTKVAEQVSDVSRGVTFLAGIGRTEASPDGANAIQLTAAAQSVASVVAGYWPNAEATGCSP